MDDHIIFRADSRGVTNFGWLKSQHTFSFGKYYSPERIQFGALRVFNDDEVEGGMGFGDHPHDNMEIISLPLGGSLEHRDSLGNAATIKAGEIQVMSAGTGVYHTEYNKHKRNPVTFLQIWIFPKTRNVEPRYDQQEFSSKLQTNTFLQILSPAPDEGGVWIHQDAWMHIGSFEAGHPITHRLKSKDNGLFIFVVEGSIAIADITLSRRDAIGISNHAHIEALANQDSQLLLIEVPLQAY